MIPVGLDQRRLSILPFLKIPVLHAPHPAVAFVVHMFEYVLVVYFSSPRFLPAGIVSNLVVGYLVPAQVDGRTTYYVRSRPWETDIPRAGKHNPTRAPETAMERSGRFSAATYSCGFVRNSPAASRSRPVGEPGC